MGLDRLSSLGRLQSPMNGTDTAVRRKWRARSCGEHRKHRVSTQQAVGRWQCSCPGQSSNLEQIT